MSSWISRKHIYGKYFCNVCGFESHPTQYCGKCGALKTVVESPNTKIPLAVYEKMYGGSDANKN